MASLGLPLPVLATILAVVVECVGGLLVVIGYQTRTTALVLAAWSVANALVAHTHFSDPNQMINFLKTSRWLVGSCSSSSLVAGPGASTPLEARLPRDSRIRGLRAAQNRPHPPPQPAQPPYWA
jgi:uncharacterized membrane protein YphA (DoxX/SURF4 family)